MSQIQLSIHSLDKAPQGSLLNDQLNNIGFGHTDFFYSVVAFAKTQELFNVQNVLGLMLDAFISHPPSGVGRLMRIRNVLVKPLGLRTASLGCPVSSLMSKADSSLFDNRYPVLDQRHTDDYAQVILGADDKHLKFRSCVAAQRLSSGQWQLSLGTRVHYNNWFGTFYMGAIDAVHRHYVAPTMLRTALNAVIKKLEMNA